MPPNRARYWTFPLALLALSILSARCALAELVNVTVDDWYRDPADNTSWVSYTPATAWLLSNNAVCSECTAHPDPTRAYFGTWHEAVFTPGASEVAFFRFEGVAVYVFCIVPRSLSDPDGNANMFFIVDGLQVGSYIRAPNGTDTYEYNVPVYVNTSLPAGNHTIEIQNGQPNLSQNNSTILLDYIVYTRNTSGTSTTSIPGPSGVISSNTSPRRRLYIIVPPVAIGGSIVLMAVVGLSVRFWEQGKARRAPPSAEFTRGSSDANGAQQESEAVWVPWSAPVVTATTGQAGSAPGPGDQGPASPSEPESTLAIVQMTTKTTTLPPSPDAGPSRLPARSSVV